MKMTEFFYDADQDTVNAFLAVIGPRYVDMKVTSAQYMDGSPLVIIVIIYLA